MKKIITFSLMCLFLIGTCNFIVAQQTEKQKKELKEKINEKASKNARKEAKRLTNDGYKVEEGALPMAKQIEDAWIKQYELDEKGYPRYIVAGAKGVGQSQIAAQMQAVEMAKVVLVGLISSKIMVDTKNDVANNQLSNEDAASITKSVQASENLIKQELGRIMPIFTAYKKIDKLNTEVVVRIAYNSEMAMEYSKKIILKNLEKDTKIAREKLDKLFKLDNLNNSNIEEEK